MSTPEPDCRRLGLRCVDCLPRNLWCDLCAESNPVTVSLPNEPWPWSYVPLGWADIVNRLAADLDEVAAGWKATQCKEKMGTLSFAVLAPGLSPEQTERVHALLRAAETESGKVCDVCGSKSGAMHTSGGWARVRCTEHVDLVPRELDDPDAVLARIEFPPGEEYRP